MASIHKDIIIDANPSDVWDAVRDFGAVHTRLAPGFVIDSRLDGDARIVTFANGNVAREQLVDCDDATAAGLCHRQRAGQSLQRLGAGLCRWRWSHPLVWIVDVLPNAIAPYIDAQMDLGVLAMQKALGRKRHDRPTSAAVIESVIPGWSEGPDLRCAIAHRGILGF